MGLEHALEAGIERVIVRIGHDPDAHTLQLINHTLGASGERSAEVGLIEDRSFHAGVGHVCLPHRFRESLIAGIPLSDRSPDDDVAHRSESERLRDLHRKLPGRIMPDQLGHGVALRRSLSSEQRMGRRDHGDDQHDEGKHRDFRHGQCLHKKLLDLETIDFLVAGARRFTRLRRI